MKVYQNYHCGMPGKLITFLESIELFGENEQKNLLRQIILIHVVLARELIHHSPLVGLTRPLPRSASSSAHLELNSDGRSPSNSRFDENSRPDPVIECGERHREGGGQRERKRVDAVRAGLGATAF